ncbi:MAG TPA: ABC transporter permease [Thermoanaerobaculia bacterium]|jgi:ABC-2 type transport system permease protein|nr:ABC transporter permease [Thermoanaerobaculia bacterium]
MNPPTTVPPDSLLDEQPQAPASLAATRPLYWSVRRELWENRSIYLAPLAVTALVLFASLIGMFRLPAKMRSLPTLNPAAQHSLVVKVYNMAPAPIMLATFLVGLFYSLDALYGERRDRSILFWKSLPVSDRTTVLSKASIPLLVLPLIAFALSVATVVVLLFLGTAVLLAAGMSPARLWAEVRFVQEPLIMLYGLTVHALWFAPLYAWLLLVSAWARRTPVLWAAFPLFAIALVERLAFRTSYFGSLLKYRVTGAMTEAFSVGAGTLDRLSQLTPARFLSAPGLWAGLIFAAACLAAAVRLRRNREPI